MPKILAPINHYPPQLVIDLAMGVEDTRTVLELYDLTDEDYQLLLANPTFRAQLAEARKTITTEGLSFKHKAKLLAEEHLDTMNEMLVDPLVPPATKLGIFQTLMKGAGLEPKPDKESSGNTPTFALQININ